MTTFSEMISKGAPTPGDVYINQLLTQISVGFMQSADDFISQKMAPSVPVTLQSSNYAQFPRGYFFRDDMQVRAPGSPSAGGQFAVDTTATYNAKVWAWHVPLDAQTLGNQLTPIDLDNAAGMLAASKAKLNREVQWTSKYFKTGVWTTEFTGVASNPTGTQFLQWGDANAFPIKDLKKMIRTQRKLGVPKPNKVVLSYDVFDAICEHPNVVGRVDRGQTPGAPAEMNAARLASLIGVDEVLVAEATYTTSKEGQTDTFDFVVPTGVLLAYVNPTPGLLQPSATYSFDWTGYHAAIGAQGQLMAKWWNQDLKAWKYEIESAYDFKVVSADCATWVNTPLG